MKSALFFVSVTLVVLQARAERYTAVTSQEDESEVTIATSTTKFKAPKTESGQQGFSDPLISPNGKMVGWLAQEPNCCTSYPIPLTLVIYSQGKVIRRFHEAPPIWQWSFALGNTAIAIQQHPTHGNAWMEYQLISISSGKTLETYACPMEGSDIPLGYTPPPVPEWVWAISDECPERKP